MNRKSRKDGEFHLEVSSDEMHVEFSSKLSEPMQQKLRQLRRWLIPTVGSVLVTFLTTIVSQPPTQQPTLPDSNPGEQCSSCK